MDQTFKHTKSRDEFYYKDILWNAYTNLDLLKRCETFKFKDSDIVINTFPRSGTTVSQEIIWHIKNKNIIEKNKKYGDIDDRFPFIEFNCKFYDANSDYAINRLEEQRNEPFRLIKTHCPLSFIEEPLLTAKPKCIVVFRNPRDVCVSYYHFYKGLDLFGPWAGEWNEFVEMFWRGYTKCGSWIKWQTEWWTEIDRNDFNSNPFIVQSKRGLPVLFYTFESLIKNPKLVIKMIANFINETLTEDQLDIILTNSNFKNMFSDGSLNMKDPKTGFTFLRKGQIGNWRDHFSDQQLEIFKNTIESDILKKGMTFDFE